MLDYIETNLQTALDAYIAAENVTNLKKVAVLDTNAKDVKYQDYLEEEQITVVYREMPGFLPSMPVSDKVIAGNFFVYALEEEKEALKAVFDSFIEANNSVKDDTINMSFQFTNLTPIGRADNKGARFYQAWQMGVSATAYDKLTSIYDRQITIAGNTINIMNGLTSLDVIKEPNMTDYPKSAQAHGKKLRYIVKRVEFSVFDSSDTDVQGLKDLVYNEEHEVTVVITSDTKTDSYTGKIMQALDSSTIEDYPVLKFIIERG